MEQLNTQKSGFVAVCGRPNVGKSTLMNHLIGQKIAITSNKPQTTRKQIRTIYTDARGQVIFLDTPGIHKPKNQLGRYMDEAAYSTLEQSDLILWLVEPGETVGKGDTEIQNRLKASGKPVILVINKTDLASRELVQKTEEVYGGLMDFAAIQKVCALRGVRTKELMDTIFGLLPYGPMYYDEDSVTDETMRQIAAEIIREKALRDLRDEVPHGIAVLIDSMKERPDGSLMDIEASIICEKDSHKGIVIGRGGEMLRRIGSDARPDIEEMCGMHVNLKLFVKVRKDWRDNPTYLRSFGYEEKDLKK